MDPETKTYLIKYVTEQEMSREASRSIYEFCKKQPPVSLTVYRGHKNSKTIREENNWYSSSKNIQVASEEFAGKDCCVFIIHLIDVPIIDVNAFLKKDIKEYYKEEEIIFLGKGKFFKNSDMTEEGFILLNNNNKQTFETWYSIQNKQDSVTIGPSSEDKIEKAFNIIDEDEYEDINDPDDIYIPELNLTYEEKIQILNKINAVRNGIGGKKAHSKKQKTRKRRYKKRKLRKSRKSRIKRSKF